MVSILIIAVALMVAYLLRWIGSYLKRKGESTLARCDAYDTLLNAFQQDINESPACCRSLVYLLGNDSRCECFRCRTQRGESVTEESQTHAEAVQERAAKHFAALVDSGQLVR